MMIDAIDADAHPKHKGAKAQSFSAPICAFQTHFSSTPQPAEEINDVERVDVFERRPSQGVMATGEKYFPRRHVIAVAVVEEYPRQVG